jgi:hypothetical protein
MSDQRDIFAFDFAVIEGTCQLTGIEEEVALASIL